MSDRKFIIGTGYFDRPGKGWASWFWPIWYRNTIQHSDPERLIVLASGGYNIIENNLAEWIVLDGDLGHCGDILNGSKKFKFSSHVPTVCALALLAYVNECDFILKEQDLLAFGPWVDKIYEESGEHGIMIGRQTCMPCANSLMLVKHSFIPDYVATVMAGPPETEESALAEHRMAYWANIEPSRVGFFSFGCDRDRPIPYDDPVFYCQKMSRDEMLELRTRGLIHFDSLPDGVERFSNG